MLHWIMGRGRCIVGRHERNRKAVRPTRDGRHTSKCRYCSAPMLRRAKYDWIML